MRWLLRAFRPLLRGHDTRWIAGMGRAGNWAVLAWVVAVSALLLAGSAAADMVLHSTLDDSDVVGSTVSNTAPGATAHGTITDDLSSWIGDTTTPLDASFKPPLEESRRFDGDNDVVDYGDNFDPGSGSLTVSLWFRFTATFVHGNRLCTKGNFSSWDEGLSVHYMDTPADLLGVRACYEGDSNKRLGAQVPFTANIGWHHVVMRLERLSDTEAIVHGFLDGSSDNWVAGGGGPTTNYLDNLIASDAVDATEAFQLGDHPVGTPPDYNGWMDDVAIWNEALSTAQIRSLHDLGVSALAYNADDVRQVWAVYDSGTAAWVRGSYWQKVDDGSLTGEPGEVVADGGQFSLALDGSGNGVRTLGPDDLATNWDYRMKITFNGYNPSVAADDTLTNFPALVVFTNSMARLYDNFTSAADWYELRFADADVTQLLNYEVESWKQGAGEVSHVWVQVPELVDGGETYIWAYWGVKETLGAHENSPFAARHGGAWDSHFRGVWHLNETGTLAARANSAPNAYQATRYDATPVDFDGDESVGGPAGNAVDLDGIDDHLDVGDHDYFDLGTGAGKEWTVSAWFVHKGTGTGWQPLASKMGAGSANTDYTLSTENGNNLWGTGWADDSVAWMEVAAEPARDGTWHYVAGTLKATGDTAGTKAGYLDGVLKQSGAYTQKAAAQAFSLVFGKYLGAPSYFEGSLDEIRISDVERSADWVWAEWKTSADNASFTTYEAAVYLGAPVGTMIRFR